MRSREFVMKDAYSFDRDEAGLDISYKKMYDAYCRIFDRLGLDYIIVDADTGAMGGSGSQEFIRIAYCEACGYAANDEKYLKNAAMTKNAVGNLDWKKLQLRTCGPLRSLCEFAKTLIYKADDKVGDRELNETKLQNLLGCIELEMADAETVEKVTGAAVGFAGPIGLDIDWWEQMRRVSTTRMSI